MKLNTLGSAKASLLVSRRRAEGVFCVEPRVRKDVPVATGSRTSAFVRESRAVFDHSTLVVAETIAEIEYPIALAEQ